MIHLVCEPPKTEPLRTGDPRRPGSLPIQTFPPNFPSDVFVPELKIPQPNQNKALHPQWTSCTCIDLGLLVRDMYMRICMCIRLRHFLWIDGSTMACIDGFPFAIATGTWHCSTVFMCCHMQTPLLACRVWHAKMSWHAPLNGHFVAFLPSSRAPAEVETTHLNKPVFVGL